MDLGDARKCKEVASRVIRRGFETSFARIGTETASDNLSMAWGIHPKNNGRYSFALRVNCKSKFPQDLLDKIIQEINVPPQDFDYREIGEISFASYSNSIAIPREPERPLTVGLSIGQSIDKKGSGTLGLFVRQKGSSKILILSCAHVLANPSTEVGQSILQPGCRYGSERNLEYCVARLQDSRCPQTSQENYMDAATAILKSKNQNVEERFIPGIGRIMGITDRIQKEDYVEKYGSETGLTSGEVDGIEMDVILPDYKSNNRIKFVNQIEIKSSVKSEAFATKGDSGSVIVTTKDEKKYVAGLIFAASSTGYGYASPINPIFRELNLELV